MLHTLFQTSLQFPQIQRFDEHFVLDILVDDGRARGPVAMNMMEGTLVQIRANAVVMATGGAGRVYRYNTNGGIVTGDGMGMALGHGVPLRDMEFVQYHPTGLPGSGILMTEGCRGEGGILVNKNGYRYLQGLRYGAGNAARRAEKNKYMELGPRDKVSQAFWHEWRKGNTIPTPRGDVVYLDLRHLGEKKLLERLPFICELAKAYVGVDPVKEPIPVRPTAHYTMGGYRDRPAVRNPHQGPVRRGRMFLRRPARRQPSGDPTRSPSWWSLAALPVSKLCSAQWPRAKPTTRRWMRRSTTLKTV